MEMARVCFKNLVVASLILFLGGCGTNRIISSDYSVENSNYVVFVVGIEFDSEFTFAENKGGDDEIKSATYIQWRGKPENGYIVAGSDPNISVALMESDSAYLCGGGNTIAFNAPDSPRVIYLADIKNLELTNVDSSQFHKNIADIALEDNFEKAKTYIDSNFPHLKGKLERWPYKLVPTEECIIDNTIEIPIILF